MKHFFLTAIVLLALCANVLAADKLWVGTDDGNEGDWSVAANWSPVNVPAAGDDVYLAYSSQDVTAGFDQSAVALTSLNIGQSYTGEVGDSDEYLQIGAAAVRIGYHDGPGSPSGSGRIKLDLGSTTAATVTVANTGASVDTDRPAVRLLAANAATTIEVRKGRLGLAYEPNETSTISSITVSYITSKTADADVYIGEGVTLTTLTAYGGDTVLGCDANTVNSYAGTLTTTGTGAIITLTIEAATAYPGSAGTITTCNLNGGTADFTRSAARTVTTLNRRGAGVLEYDPAVVTIGTLNTNGAVRVAAK